LVASVLRGWFFERDATTILEILRNTCASGGLY